MSIQINMVTGHKQKLAEILRKIADFLEATSNQRVSMTFELKFMDCPKESE